MHGLKKEIAISTFKITYQAGFTYPVLRIFMLPDYALSKPKPYVAYSYPNIFHIVRQTLTLDVGKENNSTFFLDHRT